MKKIISACLISTMLVAPCANYASAASSITSFLKKECNNVSLCKKALEHPIILSAVGIFAALHVADKAIVAAKEKIDTSLGDNISKYNGGYTHKEVTGPVVYSLPSIDYKQTYTAPTFTNIPSSDKDCNVYYSTTGKIQLNLTNEQKNDFSERGYVSVRLREAPQKEIGKFKRPLAWAYRKLTGKKQSKYNEFFYPWA